MKKSAIASALVAWLTGVCSACNGGASGHFGGGSPATNTQDGNGGSHALNADGGADMHATNTQDGSAGPSIVSGAFNYGGPNPTPVLVTYTGASGQSGQTLAYPGRVQVFVDPTISIATAKSLIVAKGGTVISQIPSFGYYLVSVPVGTEATTITSLEADPRVVFAIPSSVVQLADVVDLSSLEGPNGELPTVPNLKAQVGNGVYLYDNDDYVNPDIACGAARIAHGVATDFVASENLSGTGQQTNIFAVHGTTVPPNDVASANAIALQDATFNNTGKAVFNLSLQGAYEDANHNTLPEAQYRKNEYELLLGLAGELNALAQASPSAFDRTLYVVSAGNGVGNTGTTGLNLTTEIQELHKRFPAVFPAKGGPHMIIVGGTQQGTTTIDQGFNRSTVGGDIVYAPARGVQIGASGCKADGTSFAAPTVSNLIVRVLVANPNATVSQVTGAFMAAYKLKGYVLPTADEVAAQLGRNAPSGGAPDAGTGGSSSDAGRGSDGSSGSGGTGGPDSGGGSDGGTRTLTENCTSVGSPITCCDTSGCSTGPTRTTTVPPASTPGVSGDTGAISQRSCATIVAGLAGAATNVNCRVQNLTANSYTVVITYTLAGISGCSDENFTQTCDLVLQ